jgi:protein-L-isoaspartate O-methyltransferase
MKEARKEHRQNTNDPSYSGTMELIATENGLIRYSTSIVSKFHKALKVNATTKLLEFGAGTGFLAQIMYEKFGVRAICVELDPNLQKVVAEKGFTCFRDLHSANNTYEAIYTSNVLEHIENDVETLADLYKTLNKGGLLGIYVPAHPMLFSQMDTKVGHVRRYRKNELVAKVQSVGFTVVKVQYDDFIGFFASLLVKIVGYRSGGLGSRHSLKLYDNLIYPLSRILDKLGCSSILGKNIFLVCERTN